MTRVFAPFSAALQAANRPPVPPPTTRTSVSKVSTMSLSAMTGAVPSHFGVPSSTVSVGSSVVARPMACSMQLAAAFFTALLVMVAPEMLSISELWAAISASWKSAAESTASAMVSLEVSATFRKPLRESFSMLFSFFFLVLQTSRQTSFVKSLTLPYFSLHLRQRHRSRGKT